MQKLYDEAQINWYDATPSLKNRRFKLLQGKWKIIIDIF